MEPDGTASFSEGTVPQLVPLGDPSGMLWYQVQAWYELLKNPQSRFVWRIEESTPAANITMPPKSVKASLQLPHEMGAKAEKGSRGPKSNRPSGVPATSQSAECTAPPESKTRPEKASTSDSESEAAFSDVSAESSAYSVGSESSADEGYNPNPDYVLPSETFSRYGRRSVSYTARYPDAPHVSSRNNTDESQTEPGDTVGPVPPAQNSDISAYPPEPLPLSPHISLKNPPQTNPSGPTPAYTVKPQVEPHTQNNPVGHMSLPYLQSSYLRRIIRVTSKRRLSTFEISPYAFPPSLDMPGSRRSIFTQLSLAA